MKQVKIIHTEEQHELVLARVSELLDSDPAPGTPKGDELELLTPVIEHYEKKHFPRNSPNPVEAIKFMME